MTLQLLYISVQLAGQYFRRTSTENFECTRQDCRSYFRKLSRHSIMNTYKYSTFVLILLGVELRFILGKLQVLDHIYPNWLGLSIALKLWCRAQGVQMTIKELYIAAISTCTSLYIKTKTAPDGLILALYVPEVGRRLYLTFLRQSN